MTISHDGERQQSREGYRYYENVSKIPVSNDRRRLVILNGLVDSSTHQQWEVVVNQDFYQPHQDADPARAAIDSIRPSADREINSGSLSYAKWAATYTMDDKQDADPDADGLTNQAEFHAGTDPTSPSKNHLRFVRQVDGAYQLRYPRANHPRAITGILQHSSNLTDWMPFIPSQRAVIPLGLDQEEVILALDGTPSGYFRLSLHNTE